MKVFNSIVLSLPRTGRAMPVDVSPSEPKYFEYTFPDDVQSVLVRVTSLSSICSVVSVQDINVSRHM